MAEGEESASGSSADLGEEVAEERNCVLVGSNEESSAGEEGWSQLWQASAEGCLSGRATGCYRATMQSIVDGTVTSVAVSSFL